MCAAVVERNIDRLKNTMLPEVRSETLNELLEQVLANPSLDLGQTGISVLATTLRSHGFEDVDIGRTGLQIVQNVLSSALDADVMAQNTARTTAEYFLKASFSHIFCANFFIRSVIGWRNSTPSSLCKSERHVRSAVRHENPSGRAEPRSERPHCPLSPVSD